MLTEIYCQEFKDCGKTREPIRLHSGLNIVLGPEHGSNSIGKSTFLLVVDFAFGGRAYAKSEDIIENVGPHDIEFVHEIDGTSYRFSRTPMEPGSVWRCDAQHEKTEQLSLDEFNAWLMSAYGMKQIGGSFRGAVSNFMRIYGKDNYNTRRPLEAFRQESIRTGITRILRLYEEYKPIEKAQRLLEDATKAKKTYLDSLRRDFIVAAKDKQEYKRNQNRMEDVQQQLDRLSHMASDNLLELDPVVAEKTARLKRELSALLRARTELQSQLEAIGVDGDFSKLKRNGDFERLLEFFPNADVASFEEVEAFHCGLEKALKAERKAAKQDIQRQMSQLEDAISQKEEEVMECGSSSNLTQEVLTEYHNLSHEIEVLKGANEAYLRKDELRQDEKKLREQRDSLINYSLKTVESRLNEKMAELDFFAREGEANPPKIEFTNSSSYSFGVSNDTGTGTHARALALFDLAVLEQTSLPAIIQDSVTLKQIGDRRMVKLMELYDHVEKQVFIALDKAESYGEGQTPDVVKDNVALSLSRGHELFGRSWAAKREDNE